MAEPLQNLKLSGPAHLAREEKKKNPDLLTVREVGYTEVQHFLLNLSYSFNTADFIHIPVHPPAERAVILKKKLKGCNMDRTNEIKALTCRRDFRDKRRKFTRTQEIIIKDLNFSPYSADKVNSFSV